MRLSKNKTLDKKKTTVLALAVVLLLGAGAYAVWYFEFRQTVNDPAKMTTEERQESESAADDKKDLIENNGKPSNPGEDDTVQVEDGVEPAKLSLSVRKQSDDLVVITTDLGAVPDGKCKLQIVNTSRSLDLEAGVIYAPAGSMCAGFSVPVSDIGIGVWQIKLTVEPLSGDTLQVTVSEEVR